MVRIKEFLRKLLGGFSGKPEESKEEEQEEKTYSKEEEEKIKERLRDLGYLE